MDDLINKIIIIGINFFDSENELLEQYQTYGKIKSIRNGLLLVERENEPDFQLPNDENAIEVAFPGIYRERCSGKEIENPDFITRWSVNNTSIEKIENIKLHGFERE